MEKRIIYQPTNSFYQVLSAEAYSKHGFNIHGVVFDELHTQPNRKLFDVMTKGSGDARMQPLYFLITTAGTDTRSICYETHQKAKDILEGRKIDPTFYPVIYGADEGDDWTDPKVWKKANPSLGITVGIDKVRAACDSAKQNPAEENSFRQLRLNQWVKQAVRWMPMERWDKCAFAANEDNLEGRVCYGGLDLSSTTDITAFVLVFPPQDEDDKYSILPYLETHVLGRTALQKPYRLRLLWQRRGTVLRQAQRRHSRNHVALRKLAQSEGQERGPATLRSSKTSAGRPGESLRPGVESGSQQKAAIRRGPAPESGECRGRTHPLSGKGDASATGGGGQVDSF